MMTPNFLVGGDASPPVAEPMQNGAKQIGKSAGLARESGSLKDKEWQG